MSDGTLTLYGQTVIWDGVPLGGEVRAYDEALRAGGDMPFIEGLSLAVLNHRRTASTDPFTLEKLRNLPLNGDTIQSLRVVRDSILKVIAGEIVGLKAAPMPTAPNPSTGGASGLQSATTTAPR